MKNEILQYFDEGIGQNTKLCKGTVYGAYNAVTGYLGNVKDYKTAEKKMKSIHFGNGATINDRAFNHALALL